MTDQGFDFRGAPERRPPKQFEPPPWERDAFEELQRQRAAEEVAEAAHELEAELEAPGEPEPSASEAVVEPEPMAPQGEQERKGPSEAEVIELLSDLAREEPDPRAPAMKVTIGASLFLMPLGIMLVAWGVVAFVKANAAFANAGVARTGAATMMFFGAGFIASAFWLIYRLMKQRGVL